MATKKQQNEIKGFYVRAIALPDNDLLVINYEVSKYNIGKLQLSNCIKLFNKKQTDAIKKLLEIIEQYTINFYIIPKQNSKPNV
jgi:hypothetical protein